MTVKSACSCRHHLDRVLLCHCSTQAQCCLSLEREKYAKVIDHITPLLLLLLEVEDASNLGDIEEKMLLELHMMITDATDVCPVVNTFKETFPANAA